MLKRTQYAELQKALDAEAYEWMGVNAPEILTALEHVVTMGASPEDTKRQVIMYAGENRVELAQRVQLAARHIERMQVEQA